MHTLRLLKSKSMITLLILNAGLSFFLYANVVEKALFVDLPYLKSIQVINLPVSLPQGYSVTSTNSYGLLGRPTVLRIPKLGLNIDLDEPVAQGTQWKISNSKAYLITISKSRSGLLGDSLIFTSPGFPLMDIVTNLNEGDRFIVETSKGYKYSYRISNKMIETGDTLLAGIGNIGKVIIVQSLYNQGNKDIVVTGQYESVEGIL
jgi:hypothetical protein